MLELYKLLKTSKTIIDNIIATSIIINAIEIKVTFAEIYEKISNAKVKIKVVKRASTNINIVL